MSATIKVIDLLNKIANGEEVPKKINYNDKIFEFDELEKVYVTSNFDNTIMQGLDLYIEGLKQDSLNIEVEIIEEQEEIDIQEIVEPLEVESYECDKTDIRINRETIKKLVQAVKQLEKKIKEKK